MFKICINFTFLHVDNLHLYQMGITGGLALCIKIIPIHQVFRSYIDFPQPLSTVSNISYTTLPLEYYFCLNYLMNLLT